MLRTRAPFLTCALAVASLATSALVVAPSRASAAPDFTVVQPTPTTMDAGWSHMVFLDGQGDVFGLGSTQFGQVGGSTTATADVPRKVPLPAGVKGVSVSAEWDDTLVLGDDGVVYGTGRNENQQLTGSGSRSGLQPLTGLPGGVRAVDAAVGVRHTLVVGDDGVVYGAGLGSFGQLPGRSSASTLTPLDTLPGGAVPARVEAGNFTSYVVATDGRLFVSGYNNSGQLTGTGTRTTWAEPTGLPADYEVAGVMGGLEHTLLVLEDGSVWGAGDNSNGSLGLGSNTGNQTTFVESTTAPSAAGVAGVGARQTSAIVGADGNVHRTGPVSGLDGRNAFDVLPEVAGLGPVSEISVSLDGIIARTTDGALYYVGQGGALGESGTVVELSLVPDQNLARLTAPSVGGVAQVGSTVSATAGTWSPGSGTSIYQWRRDGAPIESATASTYDVTAADAGTALSVTQTYTRVGIGTDSQTSPSVMVPLLTFAPLSVPTLEVQGGGDPRVGRTLVAGGGGWSPDPTSRSYVWVRDDGTPTNIPGETGTTYTLTPADLGATVTVRESVSSSAYAPASASSAPVTVLPGLLAAPTTLPVVAGTPTVGQTLSVATPGTWGPGVTLGYEWLVDGDVAGTGASFPVPASAVGLPVRLRETATRTGFTSSSQETPAQTVLPGTLTVAPTTLAGTARVGSTLSVSGGAVSAGTRSVEWLRDGVVLPGVTGTTYKLVPLDGGRLITVRITARAPGYTTASRVSSGRAVAAHNTVRPSLAGSARVGTTLRASKGTWNAPGHAFRYQWLAGSKALSGETGATLKVVRGLAGKEVSVRVSAVRRGYPTVTLTSATKRVPRR